MDPLEYGSYSSQGCEIKFLFDPKNNKIMGFRYINGAYESSHALKKKAFKRIEENPLEQIALLFLSGWSPVINPKGKIDWVQLAIPVPAITSSSFPSNDLDSKEVKDPAVQGVEGVIELFGDFEQNIGVLTEVGEEHSMQSPSAKVREIIHQLRADFSAHLFDYSSYAAKIEKLPIPLKKQQMLCSAIQVLLNPRHYYRREVHSRPGCCTRIGVKLRGYLAHETTPPDEKIILQDIVEKLSSKGAHIGKDESDQKNASPRITSAKEMFQKFLMLRDYRKTNSFELEKLKIDLNSLAETIEEFVMRKKLELQSILLTLMDE